MFGIESFKNSTKNELFDQLLGSLNSEFGSSGQLNNVVDWAESLLLDGRPYSLTGHEYQRSLIAEKAPRQVFLKGAQLGITSIVMLKTMYGLINRQYQQGALYLFPSRGDVLDFSRGRFNPLINDNPSLAQFVQDTDAQSIKRIGRAMLYMRGARATSKAGGMKRSASALKSIPVDRVVFDERDEMSDDMVDLALERLSHSDVKEEVYLSTPTIPDYGVDKLFQESDQRYWFIRCPKCGKETCLESEFPSCLEQLADGKVIRLCQRCRDSEIHPSDGRWIAKYPDKSRDLVGWRISQLNSMFMDPGKILRLYNNPPNGNLTEVMNSKLAQAHIAAENRLSVSDVLSLCSEQAILQNDTGPCFMGVDVGRLLHVVIGKRHWSKIGRIVYIGAVESFNDLNALMRQFKVSRAVIDALPETRKAREFAEQHQGKVYLCYYQMNQKSGYGWNEKALTVSANRTEALDASHTELAQGNVDLPAISDTLRKFAGHCANVARVLQTDPETGSSRYVYLKTGEDHYRHAQSYECMARNYGAGGFFDF
jgi:hypothetical protein